MKAATAATIRPIVEKSVERLLKDSSRTVLCVLAGTEVRKKLGDNVHGIPVQRETEEHFMLPESHQAFVIYGYDSFGRPGVTWKHAANLYPPSYTAEDAKVFEKVSTRRRNSSAAARRMVALIHTDLLPAAERIAAAHPGEVVIVEPILMDKLVEQHPELVAVPAAELKARTGSKMALADGVLVGDTVIMTTNGFRRGGFGAEIRECEVGIVRRSKVDWVEFTWQA